MSEYDLVCDTCGRPLDPSDGVVSWIADGATERGFTLGHAACVSGEATGRVDLRRLVAPNEYLAFISARFGKVIADPEPLRAIIWAIAPFVMRHDNPAEMDTMRAASFGARPGVKPGSAAAPAARTTAAPEGSHSGK